MHEDLLLSQLGLEAEALAAAAGPVLGDPVPTCPGWSVADLVGHLGVIHRWAAALVSAGGERVDRRALPGVPAPDGAGLITWYLESAAHLRDALASAGPGAPAWTFSASSPPARTAGWWVRRQAVETAVHRVDVDLAAGRPPAAVARVVAAAGVEELLTDLLPGALAAGKLDRRGLAGTLHLHATDGPAAGGTGEAASGGTGEPAAGRTDGAAAGGTRGTGEPAAAGAGEDGASAQVEWTVDLDADPPVARRGHAKAAAALRGPASALLLWLHHRAGTQHLEAFGDPAVVAAWEGVRL